MQGHRLRLFKHYGAGGVVDVAVCGPCLRADPKGRDVAPGFLSAATVAIERCQHPGHIRRLVRAIADAAASNGRRRRT